MLIENQHQQHSQQLAMRSLKCGDRSEPSLSKPSATERECTHPAFPFPFIYSLHTARQRSSRLCSLGAIGASLVLRSPNPLLSLLMIAAAAPRQLTPIPALPHVDRHLSDSAALLRLSRCRTWPCLHPLPSHVGVDDESGTRKLRAVLEQSP